MIEVIFLNAAGSTLFTRSDMESGHWVQQEMSVSADFPYDPDKVIQRGQRIAFRDPATDNLEVFEIRQVSTLEPDHYQQLTAEHIAISELQDDHIDKTEITDKTAAQALTTALSGTGWSVGNNTASGTSSGDFSRGSVWQAVGVIKTNWNVYITPRVVISAAGVITGRYLDIAPAQGTWRGVRLSVSKNLPDVTVAYNDEDVVTALYGYGASKNKKDLTFKDEVWTATSSHPAKPSGQTYLEWPEKTALYGRNGRPRFGYYQNANITDDAVLLQKTWEALQRASEPKISISGTCEDLYRLGYADEPLRLHDLAIVEIEETGEVFYKEIIQLDVDLVDPTGNRLDIGDYIPNIIYINRQTSHHAGGGGGANNYSPEEQFNTYYQWENKTNEFGSIVGMVVGFKDGDYYIKAGEIALSINATTGESTALINADHVNISATSTVHTLAGSLEYDADGKLIIKDAGGIYIERTEQGVTAQFGVWDDGNLTGGVIVNKVNGSTNTYITGDHINISATNTVQTLAGAMEMDASGNLVIKEGAGLYVQHTVGGSIAKFGVFDNNTLTGGVIVTKVNGETGAYVNADHVNISGTNTVQTIAGAMEMDASGHLVIKEGAGLYLTRSGATFGVYDSGSLTGGVIVGKVNDQTGTFVKIQASKINLDGYVTTSMLESAFTDAQQINVDQITINNYLTCLGYDTTWKSKSVITSVTVTKTSKYYWAYCNGGGSVVSGSINNSMVTDVTRSSSTINYLGR